MTMESLRQNRAAILALAERYGAHSVRVFGSVARDEATPGGDVDFLVEMQPGRSLLDLVGLWQDLEELLGQKVDVITESGLNRYLRDRIHSEAVPL